MEQTRTEAPIGARPGSLPVAVPRSGGDVAAARARGAHGHDEGFGVAAAASAAARATVPAAVPRRIPQRHSVRAQVLAALRRALVTGDLVPGRVYSAPALAERHGVSPTPVREAMQRLASEGLVQTVPNRGFRIVEHSDRDSSELAEVRLLLELPVVLRLCRTQPAEAWEAVRPLADRTVAAATRGDPAEYADADRAFHCALLEPAGNRRLVEFAEDVQRRAHTPLPAVAGMPTPGLVSAAAEHVALLEALRVRDAGAAERILRRHLAPKPRRQTSC